MPLNYISYEMLEYIGNHSYDYTTNTIDGQMIMGLLNYFNYDESLFEYVYNFVNRYEEFKPIVEEREIIDSWGW